MLQGSLGLLCLLPDFEKFRQGVCNWYNSPIGIRAACIWNLFGVWFICKKNVCVEARGTKIRDSNWKSWCIYCYVQLLLHSLQLKFYGRVYPQLVCPSISCITLQLLKTRDWLLACGPDFAKYFHCTARVSGGPVPLPKRHLSLLACQNPQVTVNCIQLYSAGRGSAGRSRTV